MQTLCKIIPLVGGAGAAVGSVTFGVAPCKLWGVQVAYTGQGAATPVVTITCALDGVTKTVVTVTGNTNLPLCTVGELVVDDSGTPTSLYGPPHLHGEVTVDVTDGDADPAGVTVWLVTED